MFRFTLIDAENAESLGVLAFVRSDSKIGDVIPQARDRSLRIVNIPEAERFDQLPVLVVELADPGR